MRNTLESLKCGFGEGWIRSVKPIVRKIKNYVESSKNSCYMKSKKCRVRDLVTSCVGTAFYNMSLIER